jgi:hypothetical protein
MWRFFSALCIMSIVVFLGMQRGQAEFFPGRPQWQSAGDGMDRGRGAPGASSPPAADGERAGRVSAIPPPADWAPPAEIAAALSAGGNRSAVRRRALVWRPPAEIASAPFAAVVTVDRLGGAAQVRRPSKWAPPAEIAPDAPAIEHRSTAEEGALIWRAPAEIAAASPIDAVDIVSSIPPSAHWAPPLEIAAEVRKQESAFRGSAFTWRPPAEIASL